MLHFSAATEGSAKLKLAMYERKHNLYSRQQNMQTFNSAVLWHHLSPFLFRTAFG